MWPMLIVVDLVLVQYPPQMGLIPYKGAVQEFAAASPDPALGNRVHARRPDVAEHGPDPGAGEDRVECGGEVRAAVADHEPAYVLAVIEHATRRIRMTRSAWSLRSMIRLRAFLDVTPHPAGAWTAQQRQPGRSSCAPRPRRSWVRRGAGSIPAFFRISGVRLLHSRSA